MSDGNEILLLPDAHLYVYRLVNSQGQPVGRMGPSVVFTVEQALDYQGMLAVAEGIRWIRSGELIYSAGNLT